MNPGITVVVQGRNRDLRPTLESLRAQDGPAEIVVLDGGDNCLPAPEPSWLHLRVEAGEPYHWARLGNVGLRLAQTQFVLFLDGDLVLYPDHLSRLGALLQRNPLALLTAPRKNLSAEESRDLTPTRFPFWDEEPLGRGAFGAHLAGLVDSFRFLGGFDEDFTGLGVVDDHLVARWRTMVWPLLEGPTVFHLHHGPERCYNDVWERYRSKFHDTEEPFPRTPREIVANLNRPWGRAFVKE